MKAKWIIFLSVLCGWIGLGVVNPLMGPISRSIGLSEIQAGWLVSITAIMSILGSLYLGRKSDHFGRKKILLLGMTGFTITMLLFSLMVKLGLSTLTNVGLVFILLLLIRLIQGLFFGAVPSTGQAYMADITTGKQRISAMSLLGSANGLGFVFGPMLGALTAEIHLALPFLITAIFAASITLWLWISLPDPKQRQDSDAQESESKPIDFSKVWLPLACSFLLTLALTTVQVTSGFYIQDTLHLSIQEATRYIMILITLAGLSVVLAQVLIVRRFQGSPNTLIGIGLPIVCLGLLLLATVHQLIYFGIAFLLIGIGTGIALPGAMSSTSLLVDQGQQGKIAGIITSCNALGSVVAPLLGTTVYQVTPQVPYYLCSLFLVIATVLIWTLSRKFSPQITPSPED